MNKGGKKRDFYMLPPIHPSSTSLPCSTVRCHGLSQHALGERQGIQSVYHSVNRQKHNHAEETVNKAS